MATTKFYYDHRGIKEGSEGRLKVRLTFNRQTVLISTEIKLNPDQWDNQKQIVKNHPENRRLNLYLSVIKERIDSHILTLISEGKYGLLKNQELKEEVNCILNPHKKEKKLREIEIKHSVSYRLKKFADSKSPGTRGLYMQTYRRLLAFLGEDKLSALTFDEITKDWLTEFETFMAQTASKNARNIHLRNLRAVVNDAIDVGITDNYAFRRFKIKPEPTPKRSLTIDNLRILFDYQPEVYAVKYLDMFKLIFMLIGINVADLAKLERIENGRIEYKRAKTKRLYSIYVEPEAMQIINKYRGKKYLLDIMDRYTDHNDYTRHINRELKKIGELKRVGKGGKKVRFPLFPDITTYWARHSWATIASSLDIPKDVIAHALGHGNNTVTDIYINFDQAKVDIANRKVLDWVLYRKK